MTDDDNISVRDEFVTQMNNRLSMLVAENVRLRTALEAAEQDARRYRFMMNPDNAVGSFGTNPRIAQMWRTINDLKATRTQIDAAIDAALAPTEKL